MGQEFDEWGCRIGRPQCDGAVLMTEVDDGIAGVLSHGSGGAELRWYFCEGCAGGGVGVFQVACITLYNLSLTIS